MAKATYEGLAKNDGGKRPFVLTRAAYAGSQKYCGAGYVSQGEWWRNGFIITTINVVIWLTIGMAWWKFIGLY